MKLMNSLKRKAVIWVWNHTPNCVEMSRLASLQFEKPLPWRLRWKMWMHHWICEWCKRFEQQLHFLHDAAGRSDEAVENPRSPGLPDEAKKRIKERLRG